MRIVERRDDRLIFEVDREIYSDEVVFKCLYWCGGLFDVAIEPSGKGTQLTVTLRRLKAAKVGPSWEDVEISVRRSLLDFKTREIVDRETRTIRELIIAKAFSPFDELLSPEGEIEDPLGFDVEEEYAEEAE